MSPAIVFACVALCAAYAATFASREWTRTTAYVLLVAAIVVAGWLASGLPRWAIWTPAGAVIAYQLDEPRAIYVWVDDGKQPVAYRLPWDKGEAADLVDAEARSKGTGLKVMVAGKQAGEKDGYSERQGDVRFYVEPVKPLPPKARK